jgi:hypothetical protein
MTEGIYRPELNITNYVSKYYEMDPKTEDLIDGRDIKDGMRILIADPIMRENTFWTDAEPDAHWLDRAKELNRWCVVSRLEASHRGVVSFFAVYDDDTKRKRTYNVSHAWLVKLNSIPKTDEIPEQEYPTCDHAIDTHYPHCTTLDCPNYAGLYSR